MNNLYIHPSNQRILWNAINTNPYFKQLKSPDLFFKSVINTFYEKNKWVNDKYTLENLNRETMQYMINVLKGTQDNTMFMTPPIQQPLAGQHTRDYELQQRENILIGEYNRRLQDYNTEKPPPPVPANLGDTVDKPLNNMDELIAQQMKQRQQDMNYLSPSQLSATDNVKTTVLIQPVEQYALLEKTIFELKDIVKKLEERLNKLENPPLSTENENVQYTIEEKKDIEIVAENNI